MKKFYVHKLTLAGQHQGAIFNPFQSKSSHIQNTEWKYKEITITFNIDDTDP